jgi:hypothetical protein
MDTAQQAIAGSMVAFLIAIIDIFNSSPIIVEGFVKEQGSKPSGKMVLRALKAIRQKIPEGHIKIKMDHGKEFENSKIKRYCRKNDIKIIWNKKGEPWKNGFVERWFRTAKSEYLSLEFIQTGNDLRKLVRYLIAHFTLDRPHQGLNYMTPAEKVDEWLEEIQVPERKAISLKKDPNLYHRMVSIVKHLKELIQIRAEGYPPSFPPGIPLTTG